MRIVNCLQTNRVRNIGAGENEVWIQVVKYTFVLTLAAYLP